jgi:hypothetical protein
MSQRFVRTLFAASALALATAGGALAAPLDSEVTYQGELNLNGAPVNNTADFRFRLFNDPVAGAAQTGNIAVNNVQVVEGVFTVEIDFGFDVFQDDEQLFMEIQVRSPAGAGLFTILSPRQKLTPSPVSSAARRGFVPWVVQTPGTDESVTINPNVNTGGAILEVARDGVQVASLEQSGLAGGGVFRATNEGTGQLTAFWGTAFNDQSGIAALGGKDLASPFFIPIILDADADEDGSNDVFQGQITLRSVGTGGTGGSLLLQNNAGVNTLEALGGSSGDSATLSLFDPVTGNSVVEIDRNTFLTIGGELRLSSDTGANQFVLQPDFDANGGGFLIVDSGTVGFNSFIVDGNFANSGSPRLVMSGTSFFAVDCSSTDNDSVVMPGNAVASGEILDEPGVASNIVGTLVQIALAATPGVTNVASRSITVPDTGFVLAIASGQLRLNHTVGATTSAFFGVSDASGVFPASQDIVFEVPAGAPTGSYVHAGACHGVFSVGAGTHSFFVVGQERGAGGTADVADVTLTLIYLPTAYGTVTSTTLASALRGHDDPAEQQFVAPGLSPQEIILERQEEDFDRQIRMQQEIAELKAEMDTLKAMLRNNPNLPAQNAPSPRRAPASTPHSEAFGPAGNVAPEVDSQPESVPDAAEADAPSQE